MLDELPTLRISAATFHGSMVVRLPTLRRTSGYEHALRFRASEIFRSDGGFRFKVGMIPVFGVSSLAGGAYYLITDLT